MDLTSRLTFIMSPSDLIELLSRVPIVVYVLVVALLPLLFFPTSILWIATGAIYGVESGLLIISASTFINFTLAYLIGSRWMREWAKVLLHKRGLELPQLDQSTSWELTIGVRLIPGLPQIIQSYFLALSKVPFGIYMVGSLLPQVFYAAAFLLMGRSVFQGDIVLFLLSLSIAMLLHVAYKYRSAKTRIGKKAERTP